MRLNLEQMEEREVPAVIGFNVNTLDDTPFARFGNTLNNPMMRPLDANDNTSLRAIVEWGNANPQSGDWGLNRVEANFAGIAGGTITLNQAHGTLELQSNFNFHGAGAAGVTVERNVGHAAFRLFHLTEIGVGDDGGNRVAVRFHQMTLSGGRANGDGGAIWVERPGNVGGTVQNILWVENSTLTNNSATRFGGAIATGDPNLGSGALIYISNSTLSLNTAEHSGGAIAAIGATSLTTYMSSIIGNQATGNPAALEGYGGGLFVLSTGTTLEITNLIGNEATNHGGGLYFASPTSNLTMNFGQFYGNTSGSNGGGFYIDADDQTITFQQVKVKDNSASNKGGGGYVLKGTLAGSLMELTGNTAGVAIPGIAFKAGQAAAPITVPPGQQTVVQDP